MEWLNDNHMYAAQTLLKKDFPHLSGLLATTVVASRKAIPVDGDTVQILINVDNCHWICIAVDRKNPDTVRVYDSIYASLSLSSQQQILCALLHPKSRRIIIQFMSMQKQTNSSDCGVFAIACAVALCHNENPSTPQWNISEMRPHLIHCLSAKKIIPFPLKKEITVHPLKVVKLNVYCLCRMPRNKKDRMVQCEECNDWFHEGCIAVE